MAKSLFKVDKFTNPSGESAWRVPRTLNETRIRRSFKSKAEAQAEKQVLEIKALNKQSEEQTVWTTLTHAQNRDAIATVNLLKEAGSQYSLVKAVDYFIKNYQEAEKESTINEAVAGYLDERAKGLERALIGHPQYSDIRSELDWLGKSFGNELVSGLTASMLKEYLNKVRQNPKLRKKPAGVVSLKTWNTRAMLSKLLNAPTGDKHTDNRMPD